MNTNDYVPTAEELRETQLMIETSRIVNIEPLIVQYVGTKTVASWLRKNPILEKLNIYSMDNTIDMRVADIIVAALDKKTLKGIKFDDVSLSAQDIDSIAALISRNRIEHCEMARCKLTNGALKRIVDAVIGNSSITILDLQRNSFNVEDIKEICRLIKHTSTIRVLILWSCIEDQEDTEKDQSLHAIYNALLSSPFTSLTYVQVLWNYLKYEPRITIHRSIEKVTRQNFSINDKRQLGIGTKSDVSTDEHIRVQGFSTADLAEHVFEKYQRDNKWPGVRTLFVFNTPITPDFMQKWFSPKAAHLYKYIETVAFVKCGLTPTLEFMSLFPHAKQFKIID
jgi:hypothetical protein